MIYIQLLKLEYINAKIETLTVIKFHKAVSIEFTHHENNPVYGTIEIAC